MGYFGGEADEGFNIQIEFSNIRQALRDNFPLIGYSEDNQGDPQEVLYSLLDQIEIEVGEYFEPEGTKSYRSLIYSHQQRSTTCSECREKRKYPKDEILFRKFNINNQARKEQEMDALMQSINTNVSIFDYLCAHCQKIKDAVESEKVFGTPNFIFFLTGIVKSVIFGGQRTCRKSMNFKMRIEERITIENTTYSLRTVIGHIGDNSHIKEKIEESGHYISYRRVDNSWYCFNDADVKEVVFKVIGKKYQTEKVFMLVYERTLI